MYCHLQKTDRRRNIKDVSGEIANENEEHVTGNRKLRDPRSKMAEN